MIPAGWTITREGGGIKVVSPPHGPGFRFGYPDEGRHAERLLYALADALLSQGQPQAPAQPDRSLAIQLETLALRLERWAAESVAGGWSTHQVDPMRREAHDIRVLLARHAARPAPSSPPCPTPGRDCMGCASADSDGFGMQPGCTSCSPTEDGKGSRWIPLNPPRPAR